MSVLPLKSVEDTSLWKLLDQDSSEYKSISRTLAVNLTSICEEASQRVKSFSALHSQYTLHDEVHFLRVTELMYRVMPDKVRRELNPVEIALLILSAFFHDQGMVLEADEYRGLKNNPDFRVHRENWKITHPNWGDLEARLKDRNLSDAERQRLHEVQNELESAHLTDYIRESHGKRSAEFVRNRYSQDRQWNVSGRNLADLVARLSQSHVQPATDLTESNGFHYDETVGTFTVNMVYLALVLRLADILDFDRDRTPESLYRTIDFRSNVSLREWANHMSVNGWIIEPNLIRFSMECEHPEYQRAALRFMDWIDKELSDAHAITAKFYPPFNRYHFELPYLVDRSRIVPKNNAYIYHDLEFSLSRNEVVNLLMTDELYGSPSLCIRELVQNSMDALRHRAATFERDNGMKWTVGKVELTHELDKHGHEVVRCCDNGIGMTQKIIEKFLTNVGRSYYRSPEWEQERNSLKAAGVDFDPCAQFGIGFMSCFMIGDQIKIETRHVDGEPLLIEINGVGGLVVIQRGKSAQPIGTTISVTGRKKPRYVDKNNDRVQLIQTLNAYILNCEVPIIALCKIEGIEGSISISAGYENPVGELQSRGIKNVIKVVCDFSNIEKECSGLIQGEMIGDFLIDNEGEITLENEEAQWIDGSEYWGLSLRVKEPLKENSKMYPLNSQIAMDGIYTMGCAGRGAKSNNEWNHDNIYEYEILYDSTNRNYSHSKFNYFIDVRGGVKPALLPSRQPKEEVLRGHNELGKIIRLASSQIWSQILRRDESTRKREVVWSLALLHEFEFSWLPCGVLYDCVAVPVITNTGIKEWRSLCCMGKFSMLQIDVKDNEGMDSTEGEVFVPCFEDGSHVNIVEWIDIKCPNPEKSLWLLSDVIGVVSCLYLNDGKVEFQVKEPRMKEEVAIKFFIDGLENSLLAMDYDNSASEFVSVHSDFPIWSVNREHPLVQKAIDKDFQWPINDELLQNILYVICNPNNEGFLEQLPKSLPRWVIEIAFQVIETDWSMQGEEIAPPYKVRLLNGTEVTLTLETFESWTRVIPISEGK